ncbi:MAG: transaldolase [Planctomycetes bacterium]|nr:transaldolase [Planctomycetota bacterium]
MIKPLNELKISLFCDGAEMDGIQKWGKNPRISGFTTNPPLMKRAGEKNYQAFAEKMLAAAPGKLLFMEPFADDLAEMEQQARAIASWSDDIVVKLPVTNSVGKPTYAILERLTRDGIKVCLTTVMTLEQVRLATARFSQEVETYLAIFAGRMQRIGVDAFPIMMAAVEMVRDHPKTKVLWASTPSILSVYQAEAIGCDAITAPSAVLADLDKKLPSLAELSTVFSKDFYTCGQEFGLMLA